jgi:hypothetical protein
LKFFVPGILGLFLVTACGSQGAAVQSPSAMAVPAQIASAGPAGAAPVQTPVNPFYTGEGGRGASIAILSPRAIGLAADQEYLPALAQRGFADAFSNYSAISVALDNEQLQEIYDNEMSGYFDDAFAGLDLGHLTPADYILTGSITKTATGYALQISITKNADKMIAASYLGTCTFIELDNFTGVRRASLELLQKMGVESTERARTELAGAARARIVAAQTADARGYTADRGGRTVEAAIYYTQAAAIDPSMLQTASRASTLTANIASGGVGSGARDLIQQRKDWIALLTETEETIYKLIASASENPPYALFYSNNLKWGNINYQTESRDASFETNLRAQAYWFDSARVAAQSVYGAVYDGLSGTGHKNEWGLGNWPAGGVTRQNPFSTSWPHDINVVFELVNDHGKVAGRQTYNRRAQYSPRRDGNQISIAYNADDFATLRFNGVKAADISDSGMFIRVASVNGKPPEQTPFQITVIRNWEGNAIYAGDILFLVENGVVKGFRPGVDASRYRSDTLSIPRTVWTEPVTAIGEGAFANNHLGGGVAISDGATIGNNAFANNQLRFVRISDGVTTIGDSAFANNQLTNVEIPDSVTAIGNNAFANNQLYNVVPERVGRFLDDDSVIIGNGVATIGNSAFANNRLRSVVLPDSVTTIGNSAFANNKWEVRRDNVNEPSTEGLHDVIIGKGVTSIVDNAFFNNNFSGPDDNGIFAKRTPSSTISIPGNVAFIMTGRGERDLFGYIENDAIRNDNWFRFVAFYDRNGKKAGKYTHGVLAWRYSPE